MLFAEDLAEAVHNFQVVLVASGVEDSKIYETHIKRKTNKKHNTYWWSLRKVWGCGWGLMCKIVTVSSVVLQQRHTQHS